MNDEQYFYNIQLSSTDGSAWHKVHTVDDLLSFIRDRSKYRGEIRIIREYGWSDVEKAEYERLKKKYGDE